MFLGQAQEASRKIDSDDYSKATELLSEALEINPKNTVAKYFLCDIYRRTKDTDSFENLLQELKESYPEWSRLQMQEGLYLLENGSERGKDMIVDCLRSEDSHANYTTGIMELRRLGHHDFVDRIFSLLLESDMNYHEIGWVLLDVGRLEESQAFLEDFEPSNSHEEHMYKYNLACLYSRIGEYDTSMEYLRTVVEEHNQYKYQARKDKDFEAIKDRPEFQEIIE